MRTKALVFPKSILIETSNLCQGMCKFCPYQKIRKNDEIVNLDFERYKKLIDEISKYDVKRVSLFNNNEPLLDKRIYDFIGYLHKKDKSVEITLSTNGLVVDLKKILKLQKKGLTTLYISIPTVDKEAYKSIMGFSFSRINNLLSKIDDPKLLKMIRIAVPKTKYLNDDLMLKELGKFVICEWELEYKENWEIADTYNEISDGLKYVGPCDRPMDQMVISSNGNVIICCRDWKEQNVIGNIYDNTLYEIWHTNKMKKIQDSIAKLEYNDIECCKDCNMNKVYCLKNV